MGAAARMGPAAATAPPTTPVTRASRAVRAAARAAPPGHSISRASARSPCWRRWASFSGAGMRGADIVAAMAAAIAVVAPGVARADGALPDSQIIITPAAPSQQIILVTNFGLIQSADGGVTWLWACEQTSNTYGVFYQLSPPPRQRLYVLANQQVLFSDDGSCGWTPATGLSTGPGDGPADFWGDRVTPDRVLAVNLTTTNGAVTHALLLSSDGGASFGETLYQAQPGAMITGVERAASDPNTIYLTLLGPPQDGGRPPPLLSRTTDGGTTWQSVDLHDQLGDGVLGLVAVDPTDPKKVFLLWRGVDSQALVLTAAAGATARAVLTPSGVMKAFLRLDDGAILVSTDDNNRAGLFRSSDGGSTFVPVPNPPHVRALSQRGHSVYAATGAFAA